MDFFNRQKGIDGWNQELLEKQVALCLGMVIIIHNREEKRREKRSKEKKRIKEQEYKEASFLVIII